MGYLAKAGKINAAVLKRALACGTIAASFNVEDFGLKKTVALTKRDLDARLNTFRKMVSF
jgi:cytidine kinase